MRSLHRLLTLVLTAAVVGCAAHHAASRSADSADPLKNFVLEVENHNWSDIVVFVVHDGRVTRLTQVTAGQQVSLPLLPRHVGSAGIVRLAVHPIGGSSDYTSESISLRTGSTLRLTVESNVLKSSVAVW